MFGLEKKPSVIDDAAELEVRTMPPDFYGGVNPAIKFKKAEKEIIVGAPRAPELTPSEKLLRDKAAAVGAGAPMHPVNLFASKKFLFIAGAAVFLLATLGISWYYWNQAAKNRAARLAVTPPALITPVEEQPIVETPVEVATSTIEEATTTPITPAEARIVFPSRFLSEAADLDKDDITDVAEEIFGTDPSKADTDADGYSDGHEVFNLYNPAGKEPMKLVESGAVLEYTNPVYNYRLYYPKDWAVGNTTPDYKDVLFSALGGENLEVRVFEFDAETPDYDSWVGKWGPQEASLMVAFKNKFGDPGLNRDDFLVYYFVDSRAVYAVVYHPVDANTPINYRSVAKMFARSFRLPGSSAVLPDQEALVPETAPAASL